MTTGEIVIYQPDNSIRLDVRIDQETVWLNRQQLACLFGRDVKTIGKHIAKALKEELAGFSSVAFFATVQTEGTQFPLPLQHLNRPRVGFGCRSGRIPELQSLLAAEEKRFCAPVRTTTDFERLSAAMEYSLPESLGATTLKRLWGYIPGQTTPRLATLNVLAKYAGYENFKAFCDQLHAEDSSDFITNRHYVTSAELALGDSVTIGWAPNRLARLEYKGNNLFEVKDCSAR